MRYVYDFAEGSKDQKDLLGGKGAGLAEMTNLGLRVPPGFTITTEACRVFMERGKGPDGIWDEIASAIGRLEESTGRSFGGGGKTPLLVSVRSGAMFSMPGMMDTILNLGINDLVVKEIAEWAGSERVAWDIYRRFLQMFGKVVLGVPGEGFEEVLTELRQTRGVETDAELTSDDLETATGHFRDLIEAAGHTVPAEPMEQLHAAVTAVFSSWGNRRAVEYRRLHDISEALGTACNIQTMIFGDLGENSGTGVCFTRDPSSGERQPFGDYLVNAQGEDVVAGIRNTLSLADLKEQRPEVHAELIGVMDRLERHYRDMCDIEFTVENGTLWILQTRVGKRTARAAVRLAVDMANEGIIDRREAVLRVDPAALEQLQRPTIAENAGVTALAQGVAASPGAASGEAVFDADRAVERASQGAAVLLVRHETTPDDIHGMAVAQGILTSRGGKTSHAAVVARGMGKPAVTGAAALNVDEGSGLLTVGGVTIREGEVITIDGTTGDVYGGEVPLVPASDTPELEMLLAWADEFRTMGVRANADTPADATRAREAGAEGIGLARTEHMFMGERLAIVQQIILNEDPEVRDPALERLRAQQTEDFEGLLEAMDGLPVIVRLLDPPLHEFLPSRLELERERRQRAEKGQAPDDRLAELERAVAKWEETNPMLGLRGVRLGLVVPELYRIQVQAALQAMRLRTEAGGDPRLEIMVPLVSTAEELRRVRNMIESEIAEVFPDETVDVPVGTMIELPRAALLAGEIAGVADFFSFGTNDLTQTTYGLSRDDAERSFLPIFLEQGIYPSNPFQTMDEHGVGRLVEMGTTAGKEANPSLEVGVCGEHGGDPASIALCHRIGLDYVSASPPRIPVARLAAAQAALGGGDSAGSV